MSFTVGDRVCALFKKWDMYEDARSFGTIQEVNEQHGKFLVKWESKWRQPSEHTAAQLMSEAEANELYSKLEAEFNSYADVITDKMKEAGKLLAEANELAEKNGHELQSMYEQIGPLMKSMENIGWRTSSLSC